VTTRLFSKQLGHVGGHDALGQAFGDAGLATPGSPIRTGLFLGASLST